MPAPTRPLLRAALATALATSLAACAGATPGPGPSASPGTTWTRTPAAEGTPTTSATRPPASCAAQAYASLTPAQRLGQLLMVGLDTNAPEGSLDDEMDGRHVGNVILLGGWSGRAKVESAVRHLDATAGPRATGRVGPLVAVDQEGGEVRQLRGDGFSPIPSALEQGRQSPADLTASVTAWAREVAATGVDVDLAPVADTVPDSVGRANQPIGRWGRQLSNDPERNAHLVPAVVRGLHAAGLAATVKHFPGLGRVTGNTDFSTAGITDAVATVDDPYLAPFAAGIAAGADLVMVSSARYPRLDPENQAVFSRAVLTDLLRDRLGWTGVTVSDDLGNAAAVKAVAPGDRAVRFVRAGGDLVLTGNPADVGPMLDALAREGSADPAFQRLLDASTRRVLALKERRGLLPGCR